MYPFERFTDPAKKVLTLAQEEAEAAGHSYIGTEHLLLGLLREEEGLARRALNALGVELNGTRQAIHGARGTVSEGAVSQIIPTSPVKAVIEIAFEDAQRMGHNHVGTEHLLLGLLTEEEGEAANVLAEKGVSLDTARAAIDRLLEEGAREPALPQPAARRTGTIPPMSPDLQQLLIRAQRLAAGTGSSAVGLDQLLEGMVSSATGIDALARLLDALRIAAMKEQAIAAREYETAARHRAEEKGVREALAQALTAWRAELEPPAQAQASS
jgi:ATP-dependent Clp protease ATP-binding subunit ClpC